MPKKKKENIEKDENSSKISFDDINKMSKEQEKIKARNSKIRILKIELLISLLFLIVIYFLLRAWYSNGGFVIGLDKNMANKYGIALTESPDSTDYRLQLDAGDVDYITNISINWLPQNIDTEKDGSHNGDNYLAYTCYLKNLGSQTIDYYYTIYIDDVVKNLDKAIRVMVFHNGDKTVYAKASASGGEEPGTTKFYSDALVCVEKVENFKPSQVDKFTIVIWTEGDDPECLDDLIGGLMKMHMEITSTESKSQNKPDTNSTEN